MKADFYKNYVNYVSAVFVAAALSFCSCSDDRTVASGGLPYKSIRVTVDGETVTAERIDDKNLALRFDMAEDFRMPGSTSSSARAIRSFSRRTLPPPTWIPIRC